MSDSRILRGLAFAAFLVTGGAPASSAQPIKIPATAAASDSAFIAWLPQLARTLAPPDTASRLRAALVAGDYQQTLEYIGGMGSPVLTFAYELYAATRLASGPGALSRVFAERTGRMDDRTTAHSLRTTTGYFDGGQMGALWYFRQHMKYAPNAEHYLLVGPYDHPSGQRGTIDPIGRRAVTSIQNVELDSISNIDLGELRYERFNYVFKSAPKPAILRDR